MKVSAVKAALRSRGFHYLIDHTMYRRGSLWVVTGRAKHLDAAVIHRIDLTYGTHFVYASNGAHATDGVSAWFWVPGHVPGTWLRPGVLEDGPYAEA